MVGAGMLASDLLAPKTKNTVKEEAYECGIPTEGPSWMLWWPIIGTGYKSYSGWGHVFWLCADASGCACEVDRLPCHRRFSPL